MYVTYENVNIKGMSCSCEMRNTKKDLNMVTSRNWHRFKGVVPIRSAPGVWYSVT